MNLKKFISSNLKTKKGRRKLLLCGIVLSVVVGLIIAYTPKEITVSGFVGLLVIIITIDWIMLRTHAYKLLNRKGDVK